MYISGPRCTVYIYYVVIVVVVVVVVVVKNSYVHTSTFAVQFAQYNFKISHSRHVCNRDRRFLYIIHKKVKVKQSR